MGEGCSYASHLAFLHDGRNHMPVIPEDWALYTTHVASKWVEQQFLAHPSSWLRPINTQYNEALAKQELGMNDAQEDALLVRFPPAENILLDCPSVVIDSRYRIILWYIPDALTLWVQNEMFLVTLSIGDLLKKSITNGNCINIVPCWFQQGHECYGPPPENLDDRFKPEVSATLKGDRSLAMITAMQRLALLASAALHVMHQENLFCARELYR
ncbi:uncharacterized protein F5891DRAFT_985133 [Suillus fuscotomentosus]|uniref:Uncharacterized protein n=1 Tax=Suillus fuscotomentosus TaxID=1912939 RepID=A0AAD4DX59_9AGAM|nr:uncharacterized protein F5891DRAFT_985133 [Suillus fuscotomentosus]KAG1894243.1 hypothetical protein F5891DRAFT_985133 [Suillus fuscotomentosus]